MHNRCAHADATKAPMPRDVCTILLAMLFPAILLIEAGHAKSIHFPDSNLETAISEELHKHPLLGITAQDMQNLIHLYAPDRNIHDLSGLDYAVNLEELDLDSNDIEEISALERLVHLRELFVGSNLIDDLQPLETLTNLEILEAGNNRITDILTLNRLNSLVELNISDNLIENISAIAELADLRHAALHANRITDLTPLAGLTEMQWLFLDSNTIADISALATLVNLETLSLYDNRITDISALLTISDAGGLRSGSYIDLRYNLLDLSPGSTNLHTILTLSQQGVTVLYEPQKSIAAHTISVSPQPAAGGRPTGGGTYEHGTSITIEARPNSGYAFSHWTRADSMVSSEHSYTFTLLADCAFIAHFEPVAMHIISVYADPFDGGTVTGSGRYKAGEQVRVEAMANPGYEFIAWKEHGATLSTEAAYSFTAAADRTLTARFSETNSNGAPPPEDLEPSDPPQPPDPSEPASITIADAQLEHALRQAIGKPSGDITENDMRDIVSLDAAGRGIRNLSGLEHARNLAELLLDDNSITDISPLSALIHLNSLSVSGNDIADISALTANSNAGGLGNGHQIDIRHNLLDTAPGSDTMACINTLIDRGVRVTFKPQKPHIGDEPEHACIATYLLGADDARLDILRKFRDSRLTAHRAGERAIRLFYSITPAVMNACEHNSELKMLLRANLVRLIPVVQSVL